MESVPTVPERSPQHGALGRAIRTARERIGISQEELAERCGLHRTYVGGIERGERNPSFTNILRIAEAIGQRPSQLLATAERERRKSLTPPS